ncbi:MAG TPA: hypothetical protein VEQ60_28530, partial [Longimicrobium sp.]|nr:hypothetical protein [Longimicrobium sp.]
TAAAPGTAQQPAAPGANPNVAAAMDSAMTPAQATEAAAAAPAQGPVNTQAVNSYRLTMAKLRALVQAGRNIAELQARRPELRDSMRIPTMDPNLLYQKLNSVPDARAAVGRAGITPDEYALATAALLQASVVAEMRRRGEAPKGEFNEPNVKFVTDNWEEIQTLMRSAAPAPPSGSRPN